MAAGVDELAAWTGAGEYTATGAAAAGAGEDSATGAAAAEVDRLGVAGEGVGVAPNAVLQAEAEGLA